MSRVGTVVPVGGMGDPLKSAGSGRGLGEQCENFNADEPQWLHKVCRTEVLVAFAYEAHHCWVGLPSKAAQAIESFEGAVRKNKIPCVACAQPPFCCASL